MKDIKPLLRELNIYDEAVKSSNNSYVIDLVDSEEFGKYYSLLDKNPKVTELSDTSLITLHDIVINYIYKNYQLSLLSDDDQNNYRLVITELSKRDMSKIDNEEEETEDD